MNRPLWEAPWTYRILALIVFAIVLYSAIDTEIVSHRIKETQDRLKRETACQNAYNAGYAEVTAQRATYTAQDRDSLTKMIMGLETAKTDAQALAAYNQYLTTVRMDDKRRAAHPLPVNKC